MAKRTVVDCLWLKQARLSKVRHCVEPLRIEGTRELLQICILVRIREETKTKAILWLVVELKSFSIRPDFDPTLLGTKSSIYIMMWRALDEKAVLLFFVAVASDAIVFFFSRHVWEKIAICQIFQNSCNGWMTFIVDSEHFYFVPTFELSYVDTRKSFFREHPGLGTNLGSLALVYFLTLISRLLRSPSSGNLKLKIVSHMKTLCWITIVFDISSVII